MSEIVQNQYSSWQAENSAKFIYNGFIYVGQVDTDPLVEANQVRVYYIDENEQEVNLTQPIRTNSSGFPVISETNSTVIQIRTDDDYSVKVLNRKGDQEWYIPKASTLEGVIKIDDILGLQVELDNRAVYLTLDEAKTDNLNVGQYVRVIDRDLGLYLVRPDGMLGNNMDIVERDNGTFLEYVPENDNVYIKHLGALDSVSKNDNETIINRCLDLAVSKNLVVKGNAGQYRVSGPINIPNNVTFVSDRGRRSNNDNTYGFTIVPVVDITDGIIRTPQSGFIFGITLENIGLRSYPGDGDASLGLKLGNPTLGQLLFGVNIKNIDIKGMSNGAEFYGLGPYSELANINASGLDRQNTVGCKFAFCQVAEVLNIKSENYQDDIVVDTCGGVRFTGGSASHNIPSLTNSRYLIYIKNSTYTTFDGMVIENLTNNSGSNLVDVLLEQTSSGERKCTGNTFRDCRWNGIGIGKYRVQIGTLGTFGGETVHDTVFENCRFLRDSAYSDEINLVNANNTTIDKSYLHTGYDGQAEESARYVGTVGIDNVVNVYGDVLKDFTPELTIGGSSDGIAYSSRFGTYERNGNTVTVQGEIQLTSKGSQTGQVAIEGLPFTFSGDPLRLFGLEVVGNGLSSGVTAGTVGRAVSQSKKINLFKNAAGGLANLTNTDINNTSTFSFSVSYITYN